jgi:hypothetical protein
MHSQGSGQYGFSVGTEMFSLMRYCKISALLFMMTDQGLHLYDAVGRIVEFVMWRGLFGERC